eukprot:gene3158-biopygen1343
MQNLQWLWTHPLWLEETGSPSRFAVATLTPPTDTLSAAGIGISVSKDSQSASRSSAAIRTVSPPWPISSAHFFGTAGLSMYPEYINPRDHVERMIPRTREGSL